MWLNVLVFEYKVKVVLNGCIQVDSWAFILAICIKVDALLYLFDPEHALCNLAVHSSHNINTAIKATDAYFG